MHAFQDQGLTHCRQRSRMTDWHASPRARCAPKGHYAMGPLSHTTQSQTTYEEDVRIPGESVRFFALCTSCTNISVRRALCTPRVSRRQVVKLLALMMHWLFPLLFVAAFVQAIAHEASSTTSQEPPDVGEARHFADGDQKLLAHPGHGSGM